MTKIAGKTHKGFLWSAINQFLNHGSSIAITIILANLLTPEDFGLVGMVVVITEFSRVILNFGFGQALIQKSDVNKTDFSSVFWVNLGLGLLLGVVLYFLANNIASFYSEPRLILMVKWLSINYFLGALGVVPQIIFVKKLDFKSLAQIRVFSVVIAGVIAVLLAYYNFGVWSLIVMNIVRTALISVLSILKSGWRPLLEISVESLRSIFKFSVNVFGNETLNYWMDNIDKILIGRIVGDQALGLYRQSYSFMMLPVNNVSRVINSVLFPSLSLVKENKEFLSKAFNKSIRYTSYMVFPAMVMLYITSSSFVLFVLGQEWTDMIPILEIFSIVGILYALSELTFSFFLVIGRSDSLFRINFITRVIIVASIVLGLEYGIMGVAIGLLSTSPVRFVGLLLSLNKSILLGIREMMIFLLKMIVLSIMCGVIGVYTHDVFLEKAGLFSKLLLLFCQTILIFGSTYFLLFKKDMYDLKNQILKVVL